MNRRIVMEFPKFEREIECFRLLKFLYKGEEYYALEFLSKSGKIKYANLILENGVFVLNPFKSSDEEMKFKSRCNTASLYSFNFEELSLDLLPNRIALCVESQRRKEESLDSDVIDYNKVVFNGKVDEINSYIEKVDDGGNYQKINFYDFFKINGYKLSLEEILVSEDYNKVNNLFNFDYVDYFSGEERKKYQDLCDYFKIFKDYVLYSNNSKKMYDMMYVI